jgi:cell shape-determining protein MreC
MVYQATSRKGLLVAVVALLAVCAVLPPRFGRWADTFGTAATLLIAPVTQPVKQTTAWLTGEESARDPTATQTLERERDTFRTLWLQEQARSADLQRTIAELQRSSLDSELAARRLRRPVIGGASDGAGGQLRIRAGAKDAIDVNAVVTTAGVQLVGRIVQVDRRSALARLITDKKAGKITGIVMLPGDIRGPRVLLHPIGEGRLQGLVEYGPGQTCELGQTVRLDDDQWPKTARMLVIGTIVHIQKNADQRQVVTVKPGINLDRLAEVTLLFQPAEDDDRIASDSRTGEGRP